jgi:hypothetical protein
VLPENLVWEFAAEVAALKRDHLALLSAVQRSKARAATVEATLAAIRTLSPRQSDLLTEAAMAVKYQLNRSAIVAACAAVVDALHQRVARKGHLASLATARKWRLATVDDLQDYADFQVAEAAKDATTISKAQMKSVQGLIHRRNQCAHPTGYSPTLDEALGFISESLSLIGDFDK